MVGHFRGAQQQFPVVGYYPEPYNEIEACIAPTGSIPNMATKLKAPGTRLSKKSRRVANGTGRSAAVIASTPIKKTKGVCGGNARLAGTRIPVWGLENARRLGLSVKEILQRYPAVSRDSLLAAWEYAAIHPAEIERQIRENQGC